MKKRIYLVAIPFLFLVLFSLSFAIPSNSFSGKQNPTDTLQPKDLQRAKAKIVSSLMNANHYKKDKLNDDISIKIYQNYLESLDGNKMYLLQEDITSFEKYKLNFDDYLQKGSLEKVYDIYNVYHQRVEERIKKILTLLKKNKFDFTKDEYLENNRKNATWARKNKELDEVWRKQIKNQVLSLMLADKTQKEAIEVVQKRYERYQTNLKKQTSEDVFYIFMNAFTETYDPHTSYFSPIASDNFKIQMKRSLEGIGAVLRSENDYVTIAEVRAGGPAFKSEKLHKDDRIIGVAQGAKGKMVDIVGWRLDEAIQLIRGDKGTIVRLQILPASEGANAKPMEVSMVREKISLEEQSASKKLIKHQQNGKTYKIGVIELPSFYMDFDAYRSGDLNYKSTSRDVKNLIKQLEDEGIDGLVIDLRFNGGGSLPEAIKMTGLFIKEGPVVQVKDSWGRIDVNKDQDPSQVYSGPLAVMVNRFSASASEIFAGAIQDYKRGVIIGEQTFGKGTVQNIVDLNRQMPEIEDKLGHINLTLAKFYRITGSSTQHKGVMPDIQLPSPFDFNEIGESAEASALPWDEIKSAKFETYDNVSKKMLNKLQSKFQKRLETDKDLKELLADIKKIKKLRGETKVSLNLEERKKEREKNNKTDEKTEENEEEEQDKEPMKDPYIKNSIMTILDMIEF